jgi:aminobenzoyl-glutamate utilization protein B
MSIGRKGMVLAAKVLALTAMDLFTEPAQLAAARQAFDQRRAGFAYQSRLPQDAKPPLNYRDSK